MSSLIAEPRFSTGAPGRARRRWGQLDPAMRRLVVVAAIVDLAGRVAMLVDLRHRPADQLRGPRRAWVAATAISSAGIVPAAYFVLGIVRGRHDGPDRRG